MIDTGRGPQIQRDPPQIPPCLRLGRLEVWPITDLVVIASVGAATFVLLGSGPSQVGDAVRLTMVGYAVVQGSRLLHELAHAAGGQFAGRPAQRLVWTALASYCDFQSDDQKRRGELPRPLPRLAAAAGPPVNGVLGLALLGVFL